MIHRVAITGLGVVAPLGDRVEEFWSNIVAGRSGVAPIRRFDASAFPTQIAAQVDSASQNGRLDSSQRIRNFALRAVRQAVEDSGLDFDQRNGHHDGLVVAVGPGMYVRDELFASSCAASQTDGNFDWTAFGDDYRTALSTQKCRTPGKLASEIARLYGLQGDIKAVMTACSAGTQAIGDACRLIRRGLSKAVIVAGADSEVYPMGLASFCLLRALSTRNRQPEQASRPFDAQRDGFVLGEGGAALILEDWDHARRRGASIYAEIAGFGSACDSFRVTDPHPEGRGAALAMQAALRDGQVAAGQVGYINAHGTSTVLNDRVEALAIRKVFAPSASQVAVSSTKSMIGHLTVAAGVVEALVTALALRDGILPPTINLRQPDPKCELNHVRNQAREVRAEYALSNSFAFGGQCACLLLRSPIQI